MSAPASATSTHSDLPFGGAAGWALQAASGWKIERTVLPNWEQESSAFFPDQNGRVYERLLANLPVMLHAMDRQGRITAVNRHWCAVLGHAPEQVLGRLLTEFMAPDSRARLLQKVYPAYFQSGVFSAEPFDMLCADGSSRRMLLSMNAYRGAKGRIERSVCLCEPAAEGAGLHPAAAPSRPEKIDSLARLAGGLAHDLNNLLTVIGGNLELAEGRPAEGEAVLRLREAIATVRKSGGLTRQMLALARSEAGAPREVKLNDVIAGVLPLLARSLGEAAEVMADLAEGDPVVLIDPGQFESALLAIAGDARDAMPEGGRFSIETHAIFVEEASAGSFGGAEPGHHVLVAIMDSAQAAIPAERVRALESRLATMRNAVAESGGRLEIESRPGQGTAVMILLPRRDRCER